jgi:hypothetical protein
MGFLDKAKRAAGLKELHDSSLRERGIQGTAKVVSSKKTMLTEGGSRGTRFYKYGLLVTTPGQDPYEVEYTERQGWLTDGSEHSVYIDPDDRSNVFIDVEAMKDARVDAAADKLSDLTGTTVGSDQQSLLAAAQQAKAMAAAQHFAMPAPAAAGAALEPIAGITIERYAELSAAKVKQGIATQEQQDAWLKAEGIDPAAFQEAAAGWNQRMTDPAVISAYSAAFQRASA